MLTRFFECREHEEFGSLGWAMVGKPAFDPLGGMTVAHDILEHFPNDNGSVEDEFMALGASLLVRDGNVYYAQKGSRYSAGANIASDFVEHYHVMCRERSGFSFQEPGRTQTPRDIESDLDTIFHEGRKILQAELEPEDYNEFFSPQQQAKARGWFIRGYRKACRRYRNIEPFRLCVVFTAIEQKADKLLEYAKIGQRMKIAVNIKAEKVIAGIEDIENEYY